MKSQLVYISKVELGKPGEATAAIAELKAYGRKL